MVKHHNSGVYKKADLYGRGCNIVGVADLYSVDAVDGQRFAEVPLSPSEQRQYSLESGDLLYGESSLVRDGIGRTVYVTDRGAGTAFAWHTRRYALDQRQLLAPYTYYYLQSHRARKHMMEHAIQTAITGINTAAYFACQIFVPPPEEQHAIATALGDVDALLGALDKLIAKKHELKHAAMQQLLTGRTRLSGFTGEWQQRRLGNHLIFLKHGSHSRAELIPTGSVKYLHYGDIHGSAGLMLDPSATAMPCLPASKAVGLDRLTDGDVVFADASEDLNGVGKSVELQHVGETEVVSGMHTIAVRFDKQLLADGFKAHRRPAP